MIYRIAYQYTRDKMESQDITQEVFIAILDKLPFRDEEHLKAWLIRVAINKSKDYLKSSRKKHIPFDENIKLETTIKEDGLEELMQLPHKDRNIIYLYYYEGYSTQEIAHILGMTRNAVGLRLSRARANLKMLIEESEQL